MTAVLMMDHCQLVIGFWVTGVPMDAEFPVGQTVLQMGGVLSSLE
jgi:hypothetical protein